ncbi:MAG TPA: aminotransferase class I/II-fold pyridoxal phosphate-dependent enzyme [Gammaproteobacteria bacterium]|nr:aminotransferase class I/II-fold pyridoxal phosphate-dependent enzyme [Gammaproteobacteria bacterium]
MLLTPSWKPAKGISRVILLHMWAEQLLEEMERGVGDETRPGIILAGLGKPTFPINEAVAQSALSYWGKLAYKAREAKMVLDGSHTLSKSVRNKIATMSAAVDYGHPMGDLDARAKLAAALTRWYMNKVVIKPKNILFTIGGIGGMYNIFQVLNRRYPRGKIVTAFPHYPPYEGAHGENNLFPIPVMSQKGYRLTADILSVSLRKAQYEAMREGTQISAFLLCDPNNPLGTALTETELLKIAKVLKEYPDIYIILDEAYAELRFTGHKHTSLLSVAPDLKDRILLMRSATKALSAAGERMAVTVVFDEAFMIELIEENILTSVHSPRSLQFAFAEAMNDLSEQELARLKNYYHPQVKYVLTRLARMGAAMPDPDYHVDGTFYVLANLSELFGVELPPETQRALHKTGKITTDEDIAYYLLFQDGLMITPLSYFGVSPQDGFMRITCSGGDDELEELMNRLEKRLAMVRGIR